MHEKKKYKSGKTEIQNGFPFNHRVSMCERVKEILEN